MEESPLGNAFGDSVGRSKGKKSFLLIAVAAALGLGGTVLAANITIGSNNTVEFGQGVATTAPCSEAINVAPSSTYNETSNIFFLDEVEVSITDVEDQQSCDGVTLTVSVYATGTSTPLAQTAAAYASTAPTSTYLIRDNDNELFLNTESVDRITVESNR